MIQALTEEELEFAECLYDPTCMGETLFSNFDNMSLFNEDFGHIRLGQLPLLF